MRPLSKKAGGVVNRLALLAPHMGDAATVDNAAGIFMAVHVERLRKDLVSIAHYYTLNGDLMRDPEMIFWQGPDGSWVACEFQQDGFPIHTIAVEIDGNGPVSYYPNKARDLRSFAAMWMKNIAMQQEI